MNRTLLGGLTSLLLPFAAYGYAPRNAYIGQQRALPGAIEGSFDPGWRAGSGVAASLLAGAVPEKRGTGELDSRIGIRSGSPVRELIIVDASVPDKQEIFKQAGPGVEIVELDPDRDGLAQLTEILSAYRGLTALHVFSHAEDAALYLGNGVVTRESLAKDVSALAQMDHALKNGADVFLYGCDLAKTENGEALLELISRRARVNVAASNDATGHHAMGGDWDLEIRKGDVNTVPRFDSVAMSDFNAVLQFSGTVDFDAMPASDGVFLEYTIPATAHTMRIQSNGSGDYDVAARLGFVEVGKDEGNTQTSIYFTGGETFSLNSLWLLNANPGSLRTFRVTSSKGGVQDSAPVPVGTGTTINLSGAAWTDITSFTIQYPDSAALAYVRMDDVALTITAPEITSATYDANSGALVVTGTDIPSAAGADIIANKFTLTGEGGTPYTLTDTADVEITSTTSFTLTLSATDRASINLLFNKNGNSSTGGTTYALAAAEDWAAGAAPALAIADTVGNGITTSNVLVPWITSASYDANAGALVVTGGGFLSAAGASNDIVANKFTLTGEGGTPYTLTDTANVEVTSPTSFTLTLSATDRASINLLFNKNGNSSTGGTTYALAAAEDWAAGADAAVMVADTVGNGITTSNVLVPWITSASYDANAGALVVTGGGFLSAGGASNDIVANKFTLTGEGGTPYTLTDTANVEVTSPTSFTLNLSATDRAGANARLNKNGLLSIDATTYNLAAAEDWAAGADAAVTVADTVGNGITVSNALVPPTVTDGNIAIAGASGIGGAYVIGDTVTATWNNTAGGDGNSGISSVTVDFTEFGGGSAVAASNSSDTWTATYTITAGSIEATDRNISVTATNAAGSTETADSTGATVDNVAPGVGSVSVPANATYVTGQNLDFTVNTSENVTVDTGGGTPRIALTVGAATAYASYLSGSTTTALVFRYTVQTGDVDSDGIAVAPAIDANGGALKDGPGNALDLTLNSVGSTTGVLIDAEAPGAGIVVADTTLAIGETSEVTITFSEAVTGFANDDLTVANATLSAVGSSDGGITWTATLTPDADVTDATNVITLDNTGVIDGGGNAGTGTTDSNNYAVDTQAPTATLVVADSEVLSGETTPVTITFSEAVSGFTNADLTIPNGTLDAVSSGDGGVTWTATFTPDTGVDAPNNVITLDGTGVVDAVGNAGAGTSDSNDFAIRTLASTLLVTSNADSGDDATPAASLADDIADGAGLSLREALVWVRPGDTITFDFDGGAAGNQGGSIVLGGTQLVVSYADITIDGDVDDDGGADVTISGNDTSRVMQVGFGLTGIELNGLVLTQGSNGAGGAGLYLSDSANVTVRNSSVTDNVESGLGGGGIYGSQATLTLIDSTVSDNTSTSFGGGIRLVGAGGTLNLISSSVSGNVTTGPGAHGGGIQYGGTGGLTIVNSTVSGNAASGASSEAGGLRITTGTAQVYNATIVGNAAAGGGGGVSANGTETFVNTVVAGNTSGAGATAAAGGSALATGGVAADVAGTIETATNSFFGTAATITTDSGSLNNQGTASLLLADRAQSGTRPATHAPQDGSALTDAGSNTALPTDTFDVDGDSDTAEVLPLDANGNARVNGTVEIGAVEFIDVTAPTASIVVADTLLIAGETTLVTIIFSEAVSGFDNADLTIGNGTLTTVTSTDGGVTWTATLTPTTGVTDAANVITLDMSGVTDAAANAGSGTAASNTYAIDTEVPVATIVVADTLLAAGETSAVTIAFSEAVSGFDSADLSVDNGSVSAVASSDGGITWTTTLTPSAGTSDASNVITLDNTGVADAAGNAGSGTTGSNSYAIDTLVPTIGSVGVPGNATYGTGAALLFTVGASEGLIVGGTPRLALDVGGVARYATYASGSGSAALAFSYTVQAGDTDSDGIGVTALEGNGGTLRDAAGNDLLLALNGVGDTSGVRVDSTPPGVVAITLGGTPTVADASVQFVVGFDEVASNVSTDDFLLTATGSAGGSIAGVSATSGSSVSVTVNGINGTGTLRLDLVASSNIVDGSGNGNGNGGHVAAFTGGDVHTVDREPLASPVVSDPAAAVASNASDYPVVGSYAIDGHSITLFMDVDNDGAADDATVIDTAVVAGGAWTLSAPLLADSANDYVVVASDADGRTSAAVDVPTITQDSIAPAAPSTPDLVAASDTGASANDDLGNDATPTLVGTAEVGASVTVSSDVAGAIGTATADSSGDWSVTSTALDEGVHRVTAVATDAAGNASPASAALTLTIDLTAPDVSTVANQSLPPGASSGPLTVTIGDGITAAADLSFTATSSNAGVVAPASIVLGGSGSSRSIAFTTSGSGSTVITLQATDSAGNVGQSLFTVSSANGAPVIGGTPAVSVVEGQAYSFTPSASDPEGAALTFGISQRPAWASFDSTTGSLTGVPGAADGGITTGIVITVSDGALSAALPPFDIRVLLLQSIVFASLPDREFDAAPFTVGATGGGSGNPVTFSATTPSVCSTSGVNGSSVTLLAAGVCTIRASQAGSDSHVAATDVDRSFTVSAAAPGAPTDVQVTISGSTAEVHWTPPTDDGGLPITRYTVTAAPGGQTCTVTGNPPPATCTISGLQPGVAYTFTVVATNSGGVDGDGGAAAAAGSSAPLMIPVDGRWSLLLLAAMLALLATAQLRRRC